MFDFLVGNLIIIVVLYLVCLYLAYKYCYDGKADVWHNEMAEKVYYKLTPLVLILFLVEFIVLVIWAIKVR